MVIGEKAFFISNLILCIAHPLSASLNSANQIRTETVFLGMIAPKLLAHSYLLALGTSGNEAFSSPFGRLCRNGEIVKNVMLNSFQHLIKSIPYETLK